MINYCYSYLLKYSIVSTEKDTVTCRTSKQKVISAHFPLNNNNNNIYLKSNIQCT